MSQIADGTEWMGWEADGENCKRYYRPSEIKRERKREKALQIMCRLWKALFDKHLTATTTVAGTVF